MAIHSGIANDAIEGRHGPADGRLVVATYNVHRGIGSDRLADPSRVARVVGETAADVLALQEVGASPVAGTEELLDRIAETAGYTVVRGYTLPDDARQHGHAYGNALLTRFEPTRVERIDLPTSGRAEPRGAILATLDVHGTPVRTAATHLGLKSRERRHQVRRLVEVVRDALTTTDPVLVLGDMNEWRPRAAASRAFDRLLGPTGRMATFPAKRPAFALDRIWASPRSRLEVLRVHRSALARVASDHLPIVGELNLASDCE